MPPPVNRAKERRGRLHEGPRRQLETKPEFVGKCVLLEQRLHRTDEESRLPAAITINGCMGTIMPLAETSACMTLSIMNDSRYLAFCESDFVVIPSGVLLVEHLGQSHVPERPDLSARRHDHPRPLHRSAEDERQGHGAVRILTHFESDYGRFAQESRCTRARSWTERHPRLPDQTLGRLEGRDHRRAVHGHLPVPDRHQLQVRQQAAGREDAGIPLDDDLRRLYCVKPATPARSSASSGRT